MVCRWNYQEWNGASKASGYASAYIMRLFSRIVIAQRKKAREKVKENKLFGPFFFFSPSFFAVALRSVSLVYASQFPQNRNRNHEERTLTKTSSLSLRKK